MSAVHLCEVALFAPALAALLLVLVPWLRHRGAPAAGLTILSSVVATAAAVALVVDRSLGAPDVRVTVPWLVARGRTLAEVGIQLDHLSAVMLLVVTLVALCVQVFSLEYMRDEPARSYGRYFAYHALFLFSMNLLVRGAQPAPALRGLGVGGRHQLPPHRLLLPTGPARRGRQSKPSG